jgi:hypothetical protein
VIVLFSCKSYEVYLYETEAISKVKSINKELIYEDDSILVKFNFWSNNGKINLKVYNKLGVPIYIDWSKSSVILNGNRNPMWEDKTSIKTVSSFESSNYSISSNPRIYFSSISNSYGTSSSLSSVTKDEKVTFLPSKSYENISKVYIMEKPLKNLPEFKIAEQTPSLCNDNSSITLSKINFSKLDSPISFRILIVYSLSENMSQIKLVENEFYLKSISKMFLKECNDEYIHIPFESPERYFLIYY